MENESRRAYHALLLAEVSFEPNGSDKRAVLEAALQENVTNSEFLRMRIFCQVAGNATDLATLADLQPEAIFKLTRAPHRAKGPGTT